METTKATFAIYRDREEIKMAVRSFLKLGFKDSDLWIFQSKNAGAKDFSQIQKNQIKNSAIIGAILGAGLAGSFGLLATAHPFIATLAGIVVGGILGGACGALVGIGTPDPAAKRYGQYLQSGGILLSVHSENPKQVVQAKQILTATGGQDIQWIDELDTWEKANLERIHLEHLEM